MLWGLVGGEDVEGHFLVGGLRMVSRAAETVAGRGFFAAVGIGVGRAGCQAAALGDGYGERGQTGSERVKRGLRVCRTRDIEGPLEREGFEQGGLGSVDLESFLLIVEFYGGNFCSDCGDSGFPVVYGNVKVLIGVDDGTQESVSMVLQVAVPVGVHTMKVVQFGHGGAEAATSRSECVHLIENLQAYVGR